MSRVLIFLDVDGVLNSLRSMVAFNGAGVDDLDVVAIKLLDRLCGRLSLEAFLAPEVVISSTWRIMRPRLRWWRLLWAQHGCEWVRTAGMTPVFSDNEPMRRGREIADWYGRKGNGDPYVCLDDDSDFLPGQPLVLIDHRFGLQVDHVNQAFALLASSND